LFEEFEMVEVAVYTVTILAVVGIAEYMKHRRDHDE